MSGSWSLYFDRECLSTDVELLKELRERMDKGRLRVDVTLLDRYQTVIIDWRQLTEGTTKLFQDRPEQALCYVACACSDQLGKTCKLTVRIQGHEPVIPFKSMRACLLGCLVTVKGTIIRMGPIRPLVEQMPFGCGKCGRSNTLKFADGIYKQPIVCPTTGCGNRLLHAEPEHAIMINNQTIRLQEVEGYDNTEEEGKGMPRGLQVKIQGSLVATGQWVVGEQVKVTGILKMEDCLEGKAALIGNAASYQLCLVANQIVSIPKFGNETGDDSTPLTTLCREKDFVARLVHSLCPSIFGLELVKLAILLTICGGTRHQDDMRAEPHLLLIGDPGMGKSQLISAASRVAPRGVLISANCSTINGLMASITGEAGGGLEAGALVLADQGVCFLDEFDKMQGHRSLLEVMEQQQVCIAKAGVVCTLPARCSIMAAANPIGGHFDRRKTIEQNLQMDPALLSRFDLIFILLDQPDPQRDVMLSDHLLLRRKREDTMTQEEYTGLAARLRTLNTPFSVSQVRSYLAHVRQHCHPQMTSEASELLHQFYLQLRQQHHNLIPISIRTLEAMIRLSEARARLQGNRWVSAEDAQDVIDLMQYCYAQNINSEPPVKKPKGKAAMLRTFISELGKISANTKQSEFTEQQLSMLYSTLGVTIPFRELLDLLNQQGFLLKRSTGIYRLSVT